MSEVEWTEKVYIKNIKDVMLQNLFDQTKLNDNNCDLKLSVENEHIYAHKLILSAVSPYFNFMEKGSFVENQKNEIKFQNMDIETLKETVNFIYTGHITINESNIFELMEAADIFGITSFLKPAFCNFILSSLSTTNCVQTLAYCKKFRFEDLSKSILNYIWENIHFIISKKNGKFLDTPVDVLESILFTSALCVIDICKVFDKWMKHNDPCMLPYSTILSPSVYSKYLEELEKVSEHSGFIKKYKNYILKRMYLGLENINKRTVELLVDSDIYEKVGTQVLLLYGGFTNDVLDFCAYQQLNVIECMSFANTVTLEGQWCGELPSSKLSTYGLEATPGELVIHTSKKPRARHSYCTKENIIYALGGGPLGRESTCEVYHLVENIWTEIAALPGRATHDASAVICEGRVYFTGGRNLDDGDDGEVTNEVWKYNEVDNLWISCAPLLTTRACHGACSILGVMYTFGGVTDTQETLNTIEKYDDTLEKWITLTSMPERRSNFGYCTYKNYIYVFGGINFDRPSKQTFYYKSVVRYDIFTDTWERLGDLLAPRADVACCQRGSRIYLTGGHDGVHEVLSSTFIYNPETGRCSQAVSPTKRPRVHASLHCVTLPPY